MKLAVFACTDYYPDGGASDFIGFAPNGTAEEIVELLRSAELRHSDPMDCFSLLDCETGKTTGARAIVDRETVVDRETLVISTNGTSSARAVITLDALEPELIAALRKLPNVTVDESS